MEASPYIADDKSLNVKEARHRIRNRFKLKFLPDFEVLNHTCTSDAAA
jgi:hypothetical protein